MTCKILPVWIGCITNMPLCFVYMAEYICWYRNHRHTALFNSEGIFWSWLISSLPPGDFFCIQKKICTCSCCSGNLISRDKVKRLFLLKFLVLRWNYFYALISLSFLPFQSLPHRQAVLRKAVKRKVTEVSLGLQVHICFLWIFAQIRGFSFFSPIKF